MDNNAIVVGVPLIVAIVAVIKQALTPDSKYVPVISMVIGLLVSLGDAVFNSGSVSKAADWNAALQGVVLGLSASGLYDVGSNILPGKNNTPDAPVSPPPAEPPVPPVTPAPAA